jgi:tetratricopeptide (TPR) repeat protein
LVLLLTFIASSLLPTPAQGEVSTPDRAAESRALVQRLVLDRAAAVASVQRIADDREEQLFAELAEKDRRLRTEQRTRKAAQAELAEITAERQRLVDEIAARNRQFAAEIEEYRRQVASIADSPDPRKREALKRYAEGDRAGGFDALVAIQKAETKAVAAGWREIAALAQDRKDRGEMGTAEVIPFYETAQTLDADYAWGWLELRRLYQEAGRLPDARRAAEQALGRMKSDRDRAVAEMELGDVLAASGDLAGARDRYITSLEIFKRLAASNPSSVVALRDFDLCLNRVGDVLIASGDLAWARAFYEGSVQVAEHLAKSNPSSAETQRDFNVSLNRLGDVLVASGDLAGARARFEESLEIAERMAESNPSSAEAQRDVGVSLNKLGNVLVVSGDLVRARAVRAEPRDRQAAGSGEPEQRDRTARPDRQPLEARHATGG